MIPSFRAECNVAENHVVLSEAKSIKVDLSIPLRFSRDDDIFIENISTVTDQSTTKEALYSRFTYLSFQSVIKFPS